MAVSAAFEASALLFLAVISFVRSQVTTPLTPIGCQPIGYDTINLTRADYWQFSTEKGPCLNNGTKCTYYMALCKKLPDIGGASCKDASVCQKDGNGTYANIGREGNQFLKLEANGFLAFFPNGQKSTSSQNTTCTLSTYFVFVCNKETPWIPVISQSGQPPAASMIPGNPVVTYDDRECVYNVTVRYAGACYTVTPAAAIAVLSAGSVLLILVTIAFALYCVGGVTYNYCQGSEQRNLVPHAGFWEELPVNIKEGFKFTFTCGKSNSDRAYEQL